MLAPDSFPAAFEARVGRPLRLKADLSAYSSFRIGGPADFLFEAGTEPELRSAVAAAREAGQRWYVIGCGTNMLFDDAGFRGLIVRNRLGGVLAGGSPGEIRAAAGAEIGAVVRFACDRGLEGLEFMAGIPGTVGGAVRGNAGAFGRAIGEAVREVVLLDALGAETAIPAAVMEFGYRRSILGRRPSVILSCALSLREGGGEKVRAAVADILDKRRQRHPPRWTACAGSYFKNPLLPDGTRCAAGRLLDQAGARGLRVGDAAVYEGHCNFLINAGRATASDVLRLAGEMKDLVARKFGIHLEEEVIYLPAAFAAP